MGVAGVESPKDRKESVVAVCELICLYPLGAGKGVREGEGWWHRDVTSYPVLACVGVR